MSTNTHSDTLRLALRSGDAAGAVAVLKAALRDTAGGAPDNTADVLDEFAEVALWELQCGASPYVVHEFLPAVYKRRGNPEGAEQSRRMACLFREMEKEGVNIHDITACREYIEGRNWMGKVPTPEQLAADNPSIARWRQMRLLGAINPLLEAFPGASWLTVGDGRGAIEARYIAAHGSRATPMDITGVVLQAARDAGLIEEYLVGSVESLPLKTGSRDFVLAKDMLHHVSRPWLGLYEMLRVAREGICFIEPYDHSFQHSLVAPPTGDRAAMPAPWHLFEEGVGNYVYSFSDREVAKFCMGLGLPFLAYKGFADYYNPEFDPLPATPERAAELEALLKRYEEGAARGENSLELVAYVILKKPPLEPVRRKFEDAGFLFAQLPRNRQMADSLSTVLAKLGK